MKSPEAAETVRSAPILRAAAALIAVLFLLFLAMLGILIRNEKQDATRRGEDRALAAAQVVSTNALWITELSRQALGRIDAALGDDLRANVPQTEAVIREAIARLPGSAKAYVVAADGKTLFSTDPNVKPIDIRDREYFSALARGTEFYTSSLLISRLDKAHIFVFSKRLERRGKFEGAAIISFDGILLKDIWQSLQLDPLSTVSFIRNDGQLVARYPRADGPLDLSQYVLFTDYLKKRDWGTYAALSPADGVKRLVGYRRVPGTDLIALSSINTNTAYALFWRNTISTLGFALPLALALGAAAIWILRLLQRRQQQMKQLVETLALNSMLVKDTHHRVKNNLQSIISMVRMHELPQRIKDDLQHRISAMSVVHENLYRLDQVAEIDSNNLIPSIVEPLRKSFESEAMVEYDIEDLIIDRDHATPLALLINEVVTNSLKYAQPPGKAALIKIALKQVGPTNLMLSIEDNGTGFDPAAPSNGLGKRLIQAMLVQLNGTSTYRFDRGTLFEARLDFKPLSPTRGLAMPQAAKSHNKTAIPPKGNAQTG